MKKIFFPLIVCLVMLVLLVSCDKKTDETTIADTTTIPAVTTEPVATGAMDISGFKVVRPDKYNSTDIIPKAAALLKNGIEDFVYKDIKIITDEIRRDGSTDLNAKEILVGDTNRKESEEAIASIKASGFKNAYLIKVTENKIIICGTNKESTVRGVKYFIEQFVSKGDGNAMLPFVVGFNYSSGELNDTIFYDGFNELEVLLKSKVDGPKKNSQHTPTITYTRILEIQYNKEHKGTLLATCEQLDNSCYEIRRSTDGGVTWEEIATVKDKQANLYVANWQPHIYELPCKVGNLEAGTILLAGCSRDRSTAKTTRMTVWKSSDGGDTWGYLSLVDAGGALDHGMYEPYLIATDDGKLVCFYSDETEVDEVHGQRLVYKVSEDGINWGKKQYIVAPEDITLRPGMVTVAKMGNGKYIATYEIVGMSGNPIHYKVSDSLTDWGDVTDLGTKIVSTSGKVVGSAPYVAWTPLGGENGTVLMTAHHMVSGTSKTGTDLFLSSDNGKTWVTIDNLLPYKHTDGGHRYAYSPGFGIGADGAVYYVNCVNAEFGEKADFMLVKFRLK